MASLRFFFLAFFFIVLSLSCIGEVQANRKLLAPTIPNLGNVPNYGNIPGLKYPPFPPVTEWPEYRLPPPLFKVEFPPFRQGSFNFFTPPATTTSEP